MKRILSLATISFLLFSCGGNQQTEAQIRQYTTIEVEKVYNAGSVVKGEIVNAKIEIKNTGDYPLVIADIKPRSEEHTSELQSRPHLVCRLLLEKKKKKIINMTYHQNI